WACAAVLPSSRASSVNTAFLMTRTSVGTTPWARQSPRPNSSVGVQTGEGGIRPWSVVRGPLFFATDAGLRTMDNLGQAQAVHDLVNTNGGRGGVHGPPALIEVADDAGQLHSAAVGFDLDRHRRQLLVPAQPG